MRGTVRALLAAAALFGLVAALAAPSPVAAENEPPIEPIRPRLQVSIPTVSFSNVRVETTNEGRTIDIPWIADYITGVYQFAIGVAGLIAAVMIMIGGFQYLTAGGDASRVQQGKKRITDAVIGLVLLLVSYVVLYTINPALTTFDALRIKIVKRDPFVAALVYLGTTTDPTATGGSGEAGGGPAPVPGAPPSVGSHASHYPNCPIPLSEEATSIGEECLGRPARERRGCNIFKNDARSRAFFERMSALVAPISDVRERILRVADAADKCGVHMNSCGSGAGAILSIAGVGAGPGCIDQPGGHSCWAQEGPGTTTPRGGSVPVPMMREAQNSKCGTKNGVACGAEPRGQPGGCATTGPAAMARARQVLQAGIPGYPDSLANLLQPGDILWVYNANGSGCSGLHSVVFLGWASNGKAQVVQGQDGRVMRAGQTCISTRCNGGNNYTLPIRIYRARGL